MNPMLEAMQRKMQGTLQDPEAAINQGLEALKAQPQEIQQQYAPVLIRAQIIAEKKRMDQNGGNR